MDIKTINTLIEMIQTPSNCAYNQHEDIHGSTKEALIGCLIELKQYKEKEYE